MEKTIIQRASVLKFDGVEGIALSIDALLETPAQEATGKGLLLLNHRRTVRVFDVKDDNGNPVELTVTFRVERSPKSQNEAEMITNKRIAQEAGKALKTAKEENSQNRMAELSRKTAVEVAIGLANANKDPLTEALRSQFTATIQSAFGGGHKQLT